jgi:hypothetical protein
MDRCAFRHPLTGNTIPESFVPSYFRSAPTDIGRSTLVTLGDVEGGFTLPRSRI